jgi:hypothetical protein
LVLGVVGFAKFHWYEGEANAGELGPELGVDDVFS